MTNERQPSIRRQRGSLFWPLLLIVVGVIFLLNNTGLLSGDAWALVARFWPLFFIFAGLDSIWKGEGVVGSVFSIGLASAFLLSNLGVISISVWGTLMRLWPLFLVAFGFDLLIGRRSWLASIIGSVAILAILGGSLYFMGVRVTTYQTIDAQELRQELASGITTARIDLQPAVGNLRLRKTNEPAALVTGSAPAATNFTISQLYEEDGDQASFSLRTDNALIFAPVHENSYPWDLGLTGAIPLDLSLSMGAGSLNLDLTGLLIQRLQVELGVGQATITLPADSNFSGEIRTGVGELILIIPNGVQVQIEVEKALSTVNVGSGIVQDGKIYTSGGGGVDYRIVLKLQQAIGSIILKRP